MNVWHWVFAAVVFVVAWYVVAKVNDVAFTYVDGKLFPKKV